MNSVACYGGTVQSVGQVVASATMINQGTVVTATLFKILRIICLVFVVSGFGYLHQKKQSKVSDTKLSEQLLAKKSSLVPWYVIGFLLFCVLNSFEFQANLVHCAISWYGVKQRR